MEKKQVKKLTKKANVKELSEKKHLVVHYSRTGTTKKIAESLAKIIDADVEEIVDKKNRMGALGYIKAGRDAMKKELTKLEKSKLNPEKYQTIFIGTPIWAWTVSTPTRTYLEENKDKLKNKKIVFFCTQGGSGAEGAFLEMEKVVGKKPQATISFLTKEVNKDFLDVQKKLEDFCKKIIK